MILEVEDGCGRGLRCSLRKSRNPMKRRRQHRKSEERNDCYHRWDKEAQGKVGFIFILFYFFEKYT